MLGRNVRAYIATTTPVKVLAINYMVMNDIRLVTDKAKPEERTSYASYARRSIAEDS